MEETSLLPLGKSAFQRHMTDHEINALYTCKQEIRDSIEPISVASRLHRNETLPKYVYASIMEMFREGIDRECITEVLISHIPSSMNLEYFVRVLDECGYKKIAAHLFLTYITGGISYVNKSTSGQRPVVHKFFRNLKRMVHDAQFQNPRLALRQLANRFVDQMQNEPNPVRRQLLADKCIAIIGAEIDAIAITFDKRLREHDVFTQMKQLVSETSNTSITDVVYLGRLANANSIAGNFNNSEDMLTEARCRAYNTGPCLELVNMLYIEVYVKLWEFEKYPTQELRNQLMMWGRTGVESLENEDVDTKTLWRRMFILRMVFCLLGIGNRANIIENCPIDSDCLSQAKDLLSDIDRTWYGIETRRKMFYFVAKARLNELTNNVSECIDYIKVARKLANEGHFEELVFIVGYYERMIHQHENYAASQMPRERYPSRNYVLLKRETEDSRNTIELRCTLAAADEDRQFLLLNSGTDIPFSAEEVCEICEERKNVTMTNARPSSNTKHFVYKPIAYEEENNLVLLKSVEAPVDSGQFLNEPFSFHKQWPQELHDNSTPPRNFVLLHTSQDSSVLPMFDDNMTPSCHSAANITFPGLIAAEQPVALSNQLVLTDLNNRSHNFVLISSNTRDYGTINSEMLPNPKHCGPLSRIMPLRLQSSNCTVERIENTSNNDSRTEVKEMLSQHTRLMTLKGDSPQAAHNENVTRDLQENVQVRQASMACSSWQNLEPVSSSQPSIAIHSGLTRNHVEGSKIVPTPYGHTQSIHDQTFHVVQTSQEETRGDVSPDQRLNIQFKEPSIESIGSNALQSTSDFDLLPVNACQGLPRYYMVQPDDNTTLYPNYGDRSDPSGCSDDNLQVLLNQTNLELHEVNRDEEEHDVDTAKPDVQTLSFQSDDMFGD